MSKLHLLLPDILWPLEENKLSKPPIWPNTLEKLLTRSTSSSFQGEDLNETLFHLFGVENEPDADYPVGAVSFLGSGGEAAKQCWAKAIPVHLIADGDGVMLIGPDQLNITLNEAENLALDFNEHFKQDGLSLIIQDHDDWYLQLPQCPEITTYSLDCVAGRQIEHYFPAGPDRSQWLNIINETQMLFYQSQVNQRRMEKGSAVINGLWFYGFGVLPSVGKWYGSIYTTMALAKGLAMLSNANHYPLAFNFEEIRCFNDEVILTYTEFRVSREAQDISMWQEALLHVENLLSRFLKRNAFNELLIYNCMGKSFHINRKGLIMGFWKPNGKVAKMLGRGGNRDTRQ
jgi:hypothetical protein